MQPDQQLNPSVRQLKSLQSPIKGRRWLSWLLFLVMIGGSLLLPVTASLEPQKLYEWVESTPAAITMLDMLGFRSGEKGQNRGVSRSNPKLLSVTADVPGWSKNRTTTPTFRALDKVWTPGHPLDRAHQPWAGDCKVCHSQPFIQVQDRDCQSCHKNVGLHVDAGKTISAGLDQRRCTECHQEHQGEDGLAKANKHFMEGNCSACHSKIKSVYSKSVVENVSDFAEDHPDFAYLIAQSPKPGDLKLLRQSLTAPLTEKTGLKFPHSTHLDKRGIKSPKGRVTMECADCHTARVDGLGFQPVTMKNNCQSCHDLRFEPSVSNRQVPHGAIDQILSTLREFYSYVQLNRVPVDVKPATSGIELFRPGNHESAPVSFVGSGGDSHARASRAAVSLFEKTTCKVCHEVTRVAKPGAPGTPGRDLPQWEIGKVTPQHNWLQKPLFNHAKHQLAACQDCHQAGTSKKAEQVLMPSIKVCQDCHAGKDHESNKIVSDCGFCHGYHQPIKPLPTAASQAGTKSRK